MKKSISFNGDFEYELLEKNQPVVDLREQLALLYSSPFTDILLWELYDPLLTNEGYCKLFYYEQSVLKHIILLKYSDKAPKKIFVLNKEFKISLEDIENICHILFCEFDKVQQVVFEHIFDPDSKQTPKMIFQKTSNDVIILDLPESMDAYMKSLGTSTRKKIKLMMNRIERDFPDLEVRHIEKSDILYEHIHQIVSLNRNRMKSKGVFSDLNDTESNVLHQYASTSGFGFLCLCTINGKLIGSTINTVIEQHAYMHVIAHDDSYSKYAVGQIALVHATKYLIEEKNIKFYHLLCGTHEYKFRHGGINHDLYTVRIFRNDGIYYFCTKIMIALWKILKNNKITYNFYSNLKKIIMKIKLKMWRSDSNEKI